MNFFWENIIHFEALIYLVQITLVSLLVGNT